LFGIDVAKIKVNSYCPQRWKFSVLPVAERFGSLLGLLLVVITSNKVSAIDYEVLDVEIDIEIDNKPL
jgi:hypothetical protein